MNFISVGQTREDRTTYNIIVNVNYIVKCIPLVGGGLSHTRIVMVGENKDITTFENQEQVLSKMKAAGAIMP